MDENVTESWGPTVFGWLVAIGAFDAAAELVMFFLKQMKHIESVEQTPITKELQADTGRYWDEHRIMGANTCCGGDIDMFLKLLKEFESADSPEAFKSHISSLIEKWWKTAPENLLSGEWWTKSGTL